MRRWRKEKNLQVVEPPVPVGGAAAEIAAGGLVLEVVTEGGLDPVIGDDRDPVTGGARDLEIGEGLRASIAADRAPATDVALGLATVDRDLAVVVPLLATSAHGHGTVDHNRAIAVAVQDQPEAGTRKMPHIPLVHPDSTTMTDRHLQHWRDNLYLRIEDDLFYIVSLQN